MTDNRTIQAHSIDIDAPAERVWRALTSSEYTNRFGYSGDLTVEAEPGGKMLRHTTPAMKEMDMGGVALTATVVEVGRRRQRRCRAGRRGLAVGPVEPQDPARDRPHHDDGGS